jgi:hypothetical protein
MTWINIEDQEPEEDRELFYFFEHTGVSKGKYRRTYYDPEIWGDGLGDCYMDTFYGRGGFLSDDVTHWMYVDGHDWYPAPPKEFIQGVAVNGLPIKADMED